jgi:DNA-binding NarL/FixJ family response regulator
MKILLVDDHTLFREGLRLLLLSINPKFLIEQTSNPQAAIDIIVSADPKVDLVLLDLQLGRFKELESLVFLRQYAEDTPVVVLSGTEDSQAVMKSVELGAYGFIHKSAEASTLSAGLQLVFSGGVCLPRMSIHNFETTIQLSGKTTEQFAITDLTPRQIDVLKGLVQGKSNKAIAQELGIGDGTVKTHVAKILEIVGVANRTQIVFEISRRGLRLPA